MNRFDELDRIKTPADWKKLVIKNNFIVSKKTNMIKIKYFLAIFLIVIAVGISSLTITYTLSKSFRTWLSDCFGDNAKITDLRDLPSDVNGDTIALKQGKGRWNVENQFIGIVDDNYIYSEVYVLENDRLVKCSINQYQGNIDGQDYSFKYVSYDDRILGFDYQGCIIDILPRIIDNKVYVCINLPNNYDLAKISLETGEIEYITNDHISVNPISSPKQTNILINKSDQAWQNYNTQTGISNKVTNIDPYMHSNCVTFIDENTVITYDGSDGILLDILTDTITPLDKFPLEGTLVNIEYTDDKIIFNNVITGAKSEMERVDTLGTYCSLDYIVLFNSKDIYLYDVSYNKIIDLNCDKQMDEKLTGVSFIDKDHLLISTDKRVYILANKDINS